VTATNIETNVDAEELLSIAIKAMQADQDEHAIDCLKRALSISPKDARLHYLLGAVHAQLGLYPRAIEEMTQATALDPSLGSAALQLGLLHLITGDVEQARRTWAPLGTLGQDDPLRLFKTGIEYFLEEDYERAVAQTRRGMERCQLESLNREMQRIVEQAEALQAEAPKSKTAAADASPADAPQPAAADSQHVLLAGYTKHRAK
jgi:Flp pilus assembly protein TadD